MNIKTKGDIRKNVIIPNQDYDVYTYSYLSKEKKKKYNLMLFSTINKNNYYVRDSSFLTSHKVLPYKNLENIKGLISDDWNNKKNPFKRVFIMEKITNNQFKITQVTIYYPFNSNGVQIENIE